MKFLDQAAHFALGYAMARSLRGLMSKTNIVKSVMTWAEHRESLQHDDCESGCQTDLSWWRRGAEKGA